MNGGPTLNYNNNSEAGSEVSGLKASSPVSQNGSGEINGNSTNSGPLHIPAKRVGGHWTSPVSASTASPYIDTNGSGTDPLMAVSAASPYPSSHYSSLAASAEAVRRSGGAGTPTGTSSMPDTKPGLSFWQSDYHKYSAAAAASANSTTASTVGTTQGSTTASVSMATAAAVAASECSQMSAANFAAHQAAAWNYPHPGQYAAALTSPEQAAAEAARARQMAADSAAGFHADYTRLQYPPDGIYTHPPGEFFDIDIDDKFMASIFRGCYTIMSSSLSYNETPFHPPVENYPYLTQKSPTASGESKILTHIIPLSLHNWGLN